MAFNVNVDEEKCAGCEECVDVCPVEVFEMQDGKSVPRSMQTNVWAAKVVLKYVKKAPLLLKKSNSTRPSDH